MLTKVFAAALQGIDATLITIEVNSQKGCGFSLVGLPDSAVRKSATYFCRFRCAGNQLSKC